MSKPNVSLMSKSNVRLTLTFVKKTKTCWCHNSTSVRRHNTKPNIISMSKTNVSLAPETNIGMTFSYDVNQIFIFNQNWALGYDVFDIRCLLGKDLCLYSCTDTIQLCLFQWLWFHIEYLLYFLYSNIHCFKNKLIRGTDLFILVSLQSLSCGHDNIALMSRCVGPQNHWDLNLTLGFFF